MTTWNLLLKREELSEVAKMRAKSTESKTFKLSEVESAKQDGWSEKKRNKYTVVMEKPKKVGNAFEDEVWTVFYKMGFEYMNSSNEFKLSYSSSNPSLTKQIDVIAIDDEICLFVECKETSTLDKTKQWKIDLESMNGHFQGLCNEITSRFGKRKFKYVFATKNYLVGPTDLDRIKDFRFSYFDEDTVRYYDGLATHLGVASKYQLLGNIFSGLDIKNLDMRVPAIEGKMGKHRYYSFSIEPSKLLKIAYVLHRNNANHDLMPTYQRLIQKKRLESVQSFVNSGGYFPNSLIISIDSNGQKLRFDRANTQVEDSVSKVGILHLPNRYQSAYVIDGQHRLYGYSGSKFESNNSIPVVAFVDLNKDEQLKLFMDINENQKAVPKSLRNTLNIDMLWKSESFSSRKIALILHIAQKLGEDHNSPLYKRVVTGENTKTSMRCITTENIKLALEKTCFFNKYKKGSNAINVQGVFDTTHNDQTEAKVYPFIRKSLSKIESMCSFEWNRNSEGFLAINNGIYALILMIGDFVKIHLTEKGLVHVDDQDELYTSIEHFLVKLSETILALPDDDRIKIKKGKGAGGPVEAYNILRVAMHDHYEKYTYPELLEYILENCTNHNPEAIDLLTRLLERLRTKIKYYYNDETEWLSKYVPEKLRNDLLAQKAIKGFSEENIFVWDLLSFENIADLASFKTNWSSFYKDFLSIPGATMKGDAISWLLSLNKYYDDVNSNRKLTFSQFQQIVEVAKSFDIILD